jgi:hypothetical protein
MSKSGDRESHRQGRSSHRSSSDSNWVSVPLVVLGESPTTLSEMTTTTPINRVRNRSNDRSSTPSTSTARTPMTRSRMSAHELMETAVNPEQQERLFEVRFQRDAPCASDLEQEPDDDDDEEAADDYAALRVAQQEEMELAESQRAAEIIAADFVESNGNGEEVVLEGAPPGWKIPVKDDYTEPRKSKNAGEPRWEDQDNPGKWSKFTFQPKYEAMGKGKGFKYLYHALPCGATPVPMGKDGKRKVGDWEFHYDGWKIDNGRSFWSGATSKNPMPEERKGSLDGDTLKKLGVTTSSMLETDGAPDSLMFYQLLFPLCDPTRNGIDRDPRLPLYSAVSHWTNLYAVGELKLGCGYGHEYQMTTPEQIVKWDGVLIKDGVLGGSNGAMLRRFDNRKDNAMFDADICKNMTKTRYLEIKRCIKFNNNLLCPKKAQPGYDPAYKYDYIYKCLTHNVNAISRKACLDLSGDESTWPFQGFGEVGSSLVKKKLKKPGAPSGGQVVLVSDLDWMRPRAHVHRHKLHKRPKGITAEGPNEVRLIWEQLKPMVAGNEDGENVNPLLPTKPILFSEKPHITWDNYFSGDSVLEYAAKEGFGVTMTVSRNCLPSGVPGKFFHKDKATNDIRAKSA